MTVVGRYATPTTKLSYLGNLACGLNSSDISSITNSTFLYDLIKLILFFNNLLNDYLFY